MAHQLKETLETLNFSTNEVERTAARNVLEKMMVNDFPEALLSLLQILEDGGVGPVLRIHAGYVLMDVVYSHQTEEQIFNRGRWLLLPVGFRDQINARCLQALATHQVSDNEEQIVAQIVAQCVARVVCLELTCGPCPLLIDSLVANITSRVTTEAVKQKSLSTMEYIFKDLTEEQIFISGPWLQLPGHIRDQINARCLQALDTHQDWHYVARLACIEDTLGDKILYSVLKYTFFAWTEYTVHLLNGNVISMEDRLKDLYRCLIEIMRRQYSKTSIHRHRFNEPHYNYSFADVLSHVSLLQDCCD